jgi:gamma-glutamyltranspeptidase/glutathione hydrolase/leukotriene-C4 hydrolase
MNDFAFPNSKTQLAPSPSNFVRPGKRPLSSMVPTIVVNKDGNVRLVTGGAGGSKITSSVIFIICEHFFKKRTLQEAIYHSRFHHQLEPMTLQYESDFDSQIINELKTNFKHNVSKSAADAGFAAITGLSVIDGEIEAVSDRRRKGSDEIWIPPSY